MRWRDVYQEGTISFQVINKLSAESYEVLDECSVIGNISEALEWIKELKGSEEILEFYYAESFIKACDMAVQALKKQIPRKPRKTDSYRGVLKRVYAYVCPTCGNVCLEKYMNERQNTMFCWNCGQKLDWSDEE